MFPNIGIKSVPTQNRNDKNHSEERIRNTNKNHTFTVQRASIILKCMHNVTRGGRKKKKRITVKIYFIFFIYTFCMFAVKKTRFE